MTQSLRLRVLRWYAVWLALVFGITGALVALRATGATATASPEAGA